MRSLFKVKQESGRSMVEMLGVLVIIGVLTFGSITGFQYASDSTQANTIISEIRMRLAALSRHGASKNESVSLRTLKGFWKKTNGDFILDKYEVTLSQPSDEEPTLSVAGLSIGVCNRLKARTELPIKLNNEDRSVAVCEKINTAQFDFSLLNF